MPPARWPQRAPSTMFAPSYIASPFYDSFRLLPGAFARGESAPAGALTQLFPPVSLSSRPVTGRRILTVLGAALLASQAGHLLAYQLRFGAAAQQLQSSGAHAYFPTTVRAALGVAAALVLAGGFVVGLARVLGRRPVQRGSAPAYLRLVAALFTVQLGLFAAQEVGEATVAGLGADSAAHLVLWGTLGQLPVALVAAAGLRWLLARFDDAVTQIRLALASTPRQIAPAAIVVSLWGAFTRVLKPAAHRSLAKRGPPSS